MEYEKAYYYLIDYWDCFSKEQQKQINKDLNKIFGEDHPEYMDIECR